MKGSNAISTNAHRAPNFSSHSLEAHMLFCGADGPLRREIRRLPSLTRPPDTC
ncbi:hypothetical protein JI435_422820 [Parastagonospora nodorum SN15]|uniref:Uncharacterized protein n=1 Tax=Phaeosphaeria nodorum (strain SN15 / ATCC MYA-4574 / FGSC 10173) TaxID=321614 RepID=A0A7U2NPM0_PHANO|nr:hypothetical protein HBI18_226390 [Parastagonospora nodorum]QRD05835.1 hypothetical protein JI435_422820 [Parastagonospora nodorum SN15]